MCDLGSVFLRQGLCLVCAAFLLKQLSLQCTETWMATLGQTSLSLQAKYQPALCNFWVSVRRGQANSHFSSKTPALFYASVVMCV